MEELPDETLERLARVTKLLQTQRTLPAKLETIVEIVKRSVPRCDGAGVVLSIEGEPTSAAVTDRLTLEVDLVQYRFGHGPCLAALAQSEVVRIDVMERDERFTRIAPGAVAQGVHSVLSVPLTTEAGTVGALNLYSREANAFDERAEELVQPLADYAAEVIASSPLYAYSLDMVDGLVETLESRAVIEQAVGVLTATEGLTGDEAMDRLRHLALSSGEPMRTVAGWLLEERPKRSTPAEGRSSGPQESG